MEWNGLGYNETIVEKLFATVLNVLYHTKNKNRTNYQKKKQFSFNSDGSNQESKV